MTYKIEGPWVHLFNFIIGNEVNQKRQQLLVDAILFHLVYNRTFW